jgi:hypothetical protein
VRARRIEGKEPTNQERREAERAAREAEENRWTISRLWSSYLDSRPDLKVLRRLLQAGPNPDRAKGERFMRIELIIPMVPTGQARARTTVVKNKAGKIVGSRPHKSPTQAETERRLIAHLRYVIERDGIEPLSGPLRLTLMAYRPIPKSWSKKKKRAALVGACFPPAAPSSSIEDRGSFWAKKYEGQRSGCFGGSG